MNHGWPSGALSQAPLVNLDATGVARWGPQPVTGIQRVETALIRYGLANEGHRIVILDEAGERFVEAGPELREYLKFVATGDHKRIPEGGLGERWRHATRHLRMQLRYGDRETARRLGAAVSGRHDRRGFAYRGLKLVFRLGILLQRLCRHPLERIRGIGRGNLPAQRSQSELVLLSHEVNRRKRLDSMLARSQLSPVFLIHDLIPLRHPEWAGSSFSNGLRRVLIETARRDWQLLTISNAVAADIVDWDRENAIERRRPAKVCQLTSIAIQNRPEPTPLESLQGKEFALFSSSIDPRKLQDLLVRVWEKLATDATSPGLPDLVLVGRRGNGWEGLANALEEAHKSRDKIHVLHNISDSQLHWLYSRAKVALFPSRAEGWGLGISEALAHGVPVVHSDLPVLREAAQDLMPVAPVGDVEGWARLLGSLFAAPDQLAQLRRTIREEYDPGAPDEFAGGVSSFLRTLAERAE